MPVRHMVLKYKDVHAFDNYKTLKIIYSMYIKHAASGLPNPTRLEGRYYLSRLKTSRCYHT